ncbi:MAG: hypothetical protein FWE67_16265, partial [Planctomycetaceae bacterium]|nr:hypothetical protein [Planctomycetaceae bacterium]
MRSMKKGTKKQYASRPGEPPRRHSSALRKSIYFALDERRMSAVIGPVKFKGQSQGAAALEKGGTVRKTVSSRRRYSRKGHIIEKGLSVGTHNRQYKPMAERSEAEQRRIKEYYKNAPDVKETITIEIKPRPFMVPALKQEVKNMAKHLQKAKSKFSK